MNEAIFKNGQAFWLLWILPVVILLAVFAHRGVRKAALQFAGRVMTPRLLPPLDWQGPAKKTTLLVIGLALAIVAAARPAWDVFYLKTSARGLDLVVVLDVSRSMLADDEGDSRLGRARTAISWLVREIGGDRVGLLLFAGQTVQACPLTLDRGFFESTLRVAGPTSVGRGGTKIGPALEESLRMLDTSWDRDKLVLLVTDGGDQESFPKTAAERLKEKKIRVIALGLGRADGDAPLILDGKIVRREDGQPVSARLNSSLLKDLAVATEGMYVPPEEAHRLPELYLENFGHLRRGTDLEMQEKHYHEKFQWFLLAAFTALLVQAGRGPYRRRKQTKKAPRSGRGATVAATLLCALTLLVSCGTEPGRIDQGIDLLAKGKAEDAENTFLEVSGDLPDEPVVAYDLACAHQARDRAREARARYVDVLERGDKRLRARARVNLAMLAIERLRARAGQDPTETSKSDREEVKQLAEGALDELQRARELDPKLAEASRRQDLLARWLRVTENAWREHDRKVEREERAAKQGAEYLAAVIAAQEQIGAGLLSGEQLEDLVLRQRDLVEDASKTKDHFADSGAELIEAFRGDVTAKIDAAAAPMGAAAAAMESGDVEAAAKAIAAANGDMIAAWALWTDPGASLSRAAGAQSSLVQTLAQLAAARLVKTRPQDQTELENQRLFEAEARAQLESQEQRIAAWVANIRRRLDPEHTDAAWSPVFVDRARDQLPGAEEMLRRTLEKFDSKGPQALFAARDALQTLQGLALEWRLTEQDADALLTRLETEQSQLTRAAAALLSGRDQGIPFLQQLGLEGTGSWGLQKLGDLARSFMQSRAFAPVRRAQQDQADRVAYIEPALAHKEEADAPKDADENAKKQLEARRAMLQIGVGQVRESMNRAVTAARSGNSAATVAAMHAARVAVRNMGFLLSDFEKQIGRASTEQETLAQTSESAAGTALGDEPDRVQSALEFQLGDTTREQRVTTDLVAMLQRGLGQEILNLEKLEKQVEENPASPKGTGSKGTEPKDTPPAADREELAARLAVLRGLDELLRPAAEAAGMAIDAIGTEPKPAEPKPEAFDELTGRFEKAAPHQRRAADLLAQAKKRLEEARLPLKELAKRIMEGEGRLLVAARELAAGRESKGQDDTPVTWSTLRAAQKNAGSFVDRLPAALERELAQAKQSPEAQRAATPEKESEAEKVLRGMVSAIETAHRVTLAALEKSEKDGSAETTLEFVGQTLDTSRALWSTTSEFRELLERATQEEAELLSRSQTLAREAKDAAPDKAVAANADQLRTLAFVPTLQAQLEALKQQAQQQQVQQPTQSPHPTPPVPPQGSGQQGAPGGISKEVIDLAERNLPLAKTAMTDAAGHIETTAWNDALDQQEEAHRLLKEILDKIEEQENDQDQKQQQDQQQQDQPPPQLSDAERKRLLEAVRERNKQKEKNAKRTPVKEDW